MTVGYLYRHGVRNIISVGCGTYTSLGAFLHWVERQDASKRRIVRIMWVSE